MSENNYAFAVAQVRSLENALLTKNLYEQVLSSENEKQVFELLASRGWNIPEKAETAEDILSAEQQSVWKLLDGLAEKSNDLRVFTIKNDYHNLKTVIKAFAGNTDAEENLIFPASVDSKTLHEAVTEKKYDLLPKNMAEAAKEAYDALVASGDGQTADIITDRYTLKEYGELAKATGSEIVKKYCEHFIECADIKTAIRGAATGKNEEFYSKALFGTDYLDKKALARAARKGTEDVLGLLNGLGYGEAADALKSSVFDFEKWCEDKTFAILRESDFISFGIEPLIAYGFKKENEIKNIRIALTCKKMGADIKATEERMRIFDV